MYAHVSFEVEFETLEELKLSRDCEACVNTRGQNTIDEKSWRAVVEAATVFPGQNSVPESDYE